MSLYLIFAASVKKKETQEDQEKGGKGGHPSW